MNNIYAAIDLGSNFLKLKIVQYLSNGTEVLENITKPIKIGEGVISLGYIEQEKVKTLIDLLLVFKSIMDGYEVAKYKAVATSAFRLAQNGRNVTEVLFMKTGIKVEIIEDSIEKHLTYKSMRDNMENFRDIRNSALLVELNTVSCDVSVYGQNKLVLNEEFLLGSVVLKNIMLELESRSNHYPNVLRELIIARTNHIWHNIKFKRIKFFLVIGSESTLIRQHLFDNKSIVSREEFYDVYEKIINDQRNYRHEIEDSGLDWYEFVSSFIVYEIFFSLIETSQLIFPEISLRDGLLADLIDLDHPSTRYQLFNNDCLTAARAISKRYKSSRPHCKIVEKNAVVIFKALNQDFLFEPKDIILLRLSAVLHEIGKFTRMKDYLTASFEMIRNLSLLGMTQHDMLLVAYICKSMDTNSLTKDDLVNLSEKEHNLIYKLSSILSLADALDKSKTQKVMIHYVNVQEDEMSIYMSETIDLTLEEWAFNKRKITFANTFGIVPVLIEL